MTVVLVALWIVTCRFPQQLQLRPDIDNLVRSVETHSGRSNLELSQSIYSLVLMVCSSAMLTKSEAQNLLAGFPHEACGATVEFRQTARRKGQHLQPGFVD